MALRSSVPRSGARARTAVGRAAARWELEPSPKLSRLLPRVVAADATFERARACMARVPVTRLSDLTPLDPLRLPAFCAVTPLARDLTTHLGKGETPSAARASALMEAIERTSAERFPGEIRVQSFAALARERGAAPIDPAEFDLPDDTAYAPRRRISWVRAYDVLNERATWLPLDLAVNPPSEGVLRDADTNGLASGNTWLEAVVHGLCEVLERDAASQLLFAASFGARGGAAWPQPFALDLRALPESARPWRERIESLGLTLSLRHIATELQVATFHCVITDPGFPSPDGPRPRAFAGYGCDPCAELALLRAISEAVQARLAVVHGARDSYNRLPGAGAIPATGPGVRFGDLPSFESGDLRDDLRYLLDRVRAAGFRSVIVADLTQPALGIPVVRVRVPGAACFLVNRRRVGWRCLRQLT